MICWARSRGGKPRRSAMPCSVMMTCTSCSVWSTWLAIGPTPDSVLDARAQYCGGVHVSVDIGLDHAVHRQAAEPAYNLRVVADLLRAKDDLVAVVRDTGVQLGEAVLAEGKT